MKGKDTWSDKGKIQTTRKITTDDGGNVRESKKQINEIRTTKSTHTSTHLCKFCRYFKCHA